VIRSVALALFCVLCCRADDVCSKANVEKSGKAAEISWSSGTARVSSEKICTRQQLASADSGEPLAVAWPETGVVSARVRGTFTISFCCAEDLEEKTATLRYGPANKSLDTVLQAAEEDDDDGEYPDLIEEDAKSIRTSFTGDLWNGSRYVRVDIELRAAASHPHFNQSVFQYTVIDQSSEPVTVEWSLPAELSKTHEGYVSGPPEGSKARQLTQVFFGKEQPGPAHGTVDLKTADGKLLGRFTARGFAKAK